MSDTRNDPEFNEMLEYRQRSFDSTLKISTRIIVLLVILLLGMFFFLA